MEKIVAVDVIPEMPGDMRVWKRKDDGACVSFDVSFDPWVLSSFKFGNAKVSKLNGENAIRWLHEYQSIEHYNKNRQNFPYGKSLIWDDFRNQFLGIYPEYHLFQGMQFDDLTRFTFDIETEGKNPETDRILMISCACDGEEYTIVYEKESSIISELTTLIQHHDPDIIEGFNIYGFDIPFLMRRAEMLDMKLDWGRGTDASPVTKGRTVKFRIGSYDRPVKTYNVFGRHFVDGMLIAIRYDANTGGTFEKFGLKYLAEQMGIKSPDRVMVDASNMKEEWEHNRERVIEYAAYDVRETSELIALMAQPEYYLTTLLPDTFQNVLLSGGASKVNQLLVCQYLRTGQAVPAPPGDRLGYKGGEVELRRAGVFHNIAKADVASMYPSIMLYEPVVPAQDELGIFYHTLKSLTERRLQLKKQMQTIDDLDEKKYLDGIQQSYKIIINSFYGYLATGMHFSDYEAAAKVTQIGRTIVVKMADQLEAMGLPVIEVDTDGIYFQFDNDFPIDAIPMALDLPEYVTVEIEGPYKSMVSVKAKNYVLLKSNGKLEYHGNSIHSRRDEGFARRFIEDVIAALLRGTPEAIESIYASYQNAFLIRYFDAGLLAKRERITDKTLHSALKARLKAAVDQTDLEEGDYIYIYVAEDGSYKPIELYDNDEDRFYYMDRLFKLTGRLDTILKEYGIDLVRMPKKEYKQVLKAAGEIE